MNPMMKFLVGSALALLGAVPAAAAQSSPEEAHDPHDGHDHAAHASVAIESLQAARSERRTEPWPKEVLELFSTVPVQDGGRVKPVSTLADFKLLKMNGKRSAKAGAEKLKSIEWFLDVLFFPEQAQEYEMFRLADNHVLTAMGLSIDESKKRSDRYSYKQLEPGLDKLFELARRHSGKEAKDMSAFERLIIQLATNVSEFQYLNHFLDFTRYDFPLQDSEGLQTIFDESDAPRFSKTLEKAQMLALLWTSLPPLPEDQSTASELVLSEYRAQQALIGELEFYRSQGERGIAMIAPDRTLEETTEWTTPHELVGAAFAAERSIDKELEVVRGLELLEAQKKDMVKFAATLSVVNEKASGMAAARGEYEHITLETRFYKMDFFYRGLVVFLFAFLLLAFSWLLPNVKWLPIGVWLLSIAGLVLVIAGITMRCIIRERPPVSTLYETILFITACCGLVGLFLEYVTRRRVALATTVVIGCLGLFLSTRYEYKEAVSSGDTMPSLVAVLDTNFWLSTHVTTVTLGYAAGLLAAALAHVWLVMWVFGKTKSNPALGRTVARMVYGVLCFGMLFSIVGTILGGIWANYSWGRFWGWDPKENGALMIVLWELLILHMRMGGYIKNPGMCIMSVLGGVVVAFSWWGVNLLGVGLHSYGFTSGIALTLNIYYGIEFAVVLFSVAWWIFLWGANREANAQGPDASLENSESLASS